jgi:hypothetical protein
VLEKHASDSLAVLPHVPYHQWTLSFLHRVRWVLLKDAGLLSPTSPYS